MKVLAISNSTPFFFPARCALKPLLFKNLVFLDRFFWPFLFFLAPLRVEKPCVLPLFFSIAETLQQAKGSKKNVALGHLHAPRADVAESCQKMHWQKFARVPPFIFLKIGPYFTQSCGCLLFAAFAAFVCMSCPPPPAVPSS